MITSADTMRKAFLGHDGGSSLATSFCGPHRRSNVTSLRSTWWGVASCDALYVLADPYRPIIAKLALSAHLPSIYQYSQFVDVGGLMSYGPDVLNIFKRAAVYVDKIIKSTNPADLPIEQPTKFYFFLNLKTAKALGLSVAEAVIAQADTVIE